MSWPFGVAYPTTDRYHNSARVMYMLGQGPTYADDDNIICVTAEDRSCLRRDDAWITGPELSMTWNVKRSYYSDTDLDKRRPFRDEDQQHTVAATPLILEPTTTLFTFTPPAPPAPDDDRSLRKAIRDRISDAAGILIPFRLSGHRRLRLISSSFVSSSSSISASESESAMFDQICSVLDDTIASGRGRMEIHVTVDKQITISHQQYEAYRANWEMLRRQHPEERFQQVEWEYRYNTLRRRRPPQQPQQQGPQPRSIIGRNPATKGSVEALEKFTLTITSSCGDDGQDDDDKVKMCAICWEEMLTGSKVIRMPCSHMFHSDCTLKWLAFAHTCPLCRFKLPNNNGYI